MQIVINIPKDRYKHICEEQWLPNRLYYEKAIANGTPIPDNATNGDIVQMMFPKIDTNFSNVIDLNLWWKSRYQKGDGNEVN